MSYRRSQDFSISSMIQFNCDGSLSTTKKWTIKNCTSTSCSFEIVLNEKVMTTFSELYIPSRTLAYGVYQLTLTVTMIDSPNLKSSSSAYVRITATGITANLVQLGTSMITRGDQQDLLLDPGTFSVDPDEDIFDATKWKYTYYCRIYDLYNFPNVQGILLSIDDSRIDPYNPSCLSNRSGLIFGNLTLSPNSSLTVLSGSLQLNQIYQFMVYMENRKNSSIQATGYVLVTVEVTHPQLIAVGCVISTMCVPNLEFQLLNPTTQVALFTICIGTCTNLQSIKWNIYQGSDNSTSSNSTQWTLFNNTILYENIWFFGINTSNFTATDLLFLNNLQISLWRFEVVYTFQSAISTSALNFIINQPPANGSCSINPLNGTITTLFNITCPNWYDVDGIQDYSLYAWTTDISQRTIIAFSPEDNFQVRLPVGDNETSLLNLVVYVRDLVGSVTQVNISSVNVITDLAIINDLIDKITNLSSTITNNPIVRLLSSGNQNVVGQMITSLSQEFNQMNSENLDKAISNGIPAATILVSSLGSSSLQQVSIPLNESALIDYNTELNSLANVRDYLVTFITNLLITTSNSIILQSSSLVQLTQATNQLTRNTLMLVSNRCYELSAALYAIFEKISYEDAQSASNQLFQCASNILNAVNGPLQGRTDVLDLDYSRANAISTDYDTDLESAWSNLNLFSDGNDFSTATIDKNRNIYYQKQLANQINSQVTQMISLLTSSLNIHLNIGQSSLMNTSQSFVSLETISIASLKDRLVKQVENAQFNIPSDFILNTTSNSSISLRSRVDTLASFENFQNTNLSRSVSLSIIDQNGNEVSFEAHQNNPIQLIIPRDPNLIIPSMYLQNVTSINSTNNNLLFNYHYINITSSLPISVHFEIHSLNTNLSYLFIYKFDQTPLLNSSINLIDGWTMFCPFNLTNDDIYRYFIDNQQTPGHQSLIFGIRELNSTEMNNYCLNNSSINTSLPITDEPFNFTSNYELRIYTSGCYYLDENNDWKSDGLIVRSLTNHYETECLSTHLTSFAGGFIVLPAPINWSYVFANAGFLKNKTIYLTVICMSIAYIILMIFGRFKDKKDIEKLGVTPLADNNKSDQYYYQIIVFTGQRANSGTQSKVKKMNFVFTIGTLPYGIFIDGINTVYVPNRVSNTILSWPQWNTTPTSNSYSNLNNPYSLFMSMTGDIYTDNGYLYGRVDKYVFNTSNRVTVMNVNGSCYGLFIDINNNLYCSLKNLHQVVTLLLNNSTTIPTIAAGNGSAGSLSNMLNSPQGIYVDSNLNLYIADSANNRIQFVQTGQLDGVTIVGNGSSANITLNYPTGIVLDANGYLFIVDSYNHRIVASSSTGFRCIVGCSGGGLSASQLSFPQSMAFDSYGNMYVTDRNNSRVQQFALQTNNCSKLFLYNGTLRSCS
ncbi:unnamed protein product [Adineta steineri]|uniref:PKD/REJ-like domain-containing protein n=1 Tax=Adineta steineri TaxID=433720 RepID=A0A814QWR8_9BILA|nr:unnamed protein product [Adineta steineri]